jgi:hypothetical protein
MRDPTASVSSLPALGEVPRGPRRIPLAHLGRLTFIRPAEARTEPELVAGRAHEETDPALDMIVRGADRETLPTLSINGVTTPLSSAAIGSSQWQHVSPTGTGTCGAA